MNPLYTFHAFVQGYPHTPQHSKYGRYKDVQFLIQNSDSHLRFLGQIYKLSRDDRGLGPAQLISRARFLGRLPRPSDSLLRWSPPNGLVELDELHGPGSRFVARQGLTEGVLPALDEVVDTVVGNDHVPSVEDGGLLG